jgi:aspartate racemase
MKTLGIIGGMSWQSTQTYYHLINKGISARLGGYHSARMIVYSLDFADIEHHQADGNWKEAGEVLINAALALEKAGADLLLIATNTMHKVADMVTDKSKLPLIHIVDVTAKAIQQLGITKVGLLGTRFTMEQDFYRLRLEDSFGIQTIIPPIKERAFINDIIYNELCRGEIKASSKQKVLEVIDNLITKEIQGVILGCTELPLFISPKDAKIPVFDTTELHAKAAVELILRDE